MTPLQNTISEIDQLHSQLESLKPLKKEDEERLWKKFRLEWNYNSNHIEGNTLTYGQTELLLIFDKTTGDHEMREYEEMKAHDVALKMIVDFAKDKSREITESDIRELNKIILVRPYWSNAQTQDGQPTRKLIQPGEYKKEPNSVLLQNGEMFHYASPEETPVLMKELMEWYHQTSREKKLHPVEIAALIHYRFVRIHPFDDSNGRTSRLLMNYVLLRNNYPPVIIKSADKKNYLNALNKADVGNLDAFVLYIAEQLKWSLDLNIKAGKGEDIEEHDDIDKEIEILKKEQNQQVKNTVPRSIEILEKLTNSSIIPLIEGLIEKHNKISDFFLSNEFSIYVDNRNGSRINNAYEAETFLLSTLEDYETKKSLPPSPNQWSFQLYHDDLKTSPQKKSFFNRTLKFVFHPLRYDLFYDTKQLLSKLYHQNLSKEEINSIVNNSVKEILDQIRKSNH